MSPSELLALSSNGGRKQEGLITPPSKKRGRPLEIDVRRKEAALAARARGESWKEAAKLLYGTSYPSTQQVKNAPNVLNYYKRSVALLPNKS